MPNMLPRTFAQMNCLRDAMIPALVNIGFSQFLGQPLMVVTIFQAVFTEHAKLLFSFSKALWNIISCNKASMGNFIHSHGHRRYKIGIFGC